MMTSWKKVICKVLAAAVCTVFISQCLAVAVIAASSEFVAPITYLLFDEDCTGMKLRPGYSAGQQSATGGKKAYYDIYTKIAGAAPLYLTAVAAAGLEGHDNGYLFSFFPDNSVQYQFQAVASDSKSMQGVASNWSTPYSVSFDYGQQKTASVPVADPGLPRVVATATPVVLDAGDSYDPATGDNSGLLYRWECYNSKTTVAISGLDTKNPSFIPAESGLYSFRLIVSREKADGSGEEEGSQSGIRYVNIRVVDLLVGTLTAHPGVPLQVALGDKIVLDGSLSLPTPADNGAYRWELINRDHLTTSVTVFNDGSPVASFLPDTVGTHVFRLTVMTDDDYTYGLVTVSVYDSAAVGSLVEQNIAEGCTLDCSIADLNGDSRVDGLDTALIQAAEHSGRGEAAYFKEADFDRNLQINSNDIAVVAACKGKSF